jgi:hypothetical protein
MIRPAGGEGESVDVIWPRTSTRLCPAFALAHWPRAPYVVAFNNHTSLYVGMRQQSINCTRQSSAIDRLLLSNADFAHLPAPLHPITHLTSALILLFSLLSPPLNQILPLSHVR